MNVIFYIIALLEWFTTLSVEIMSIRNSISIIWSNSISTSIILWIILIALSYWYYRWGILASNNSKEFIKNKIYKNLLFASILYVAVSFPFENLFLDYFLKLWLWYFLSIFISILFLFFLPVFLASQTIPLLSELIDDSKKWETIWRLLFFSTIGSFLWSVLTSLVFFPYFWVINSIVVNSIILSILAIVILIINKHDILSNVLMFNFMYLLILIIILTQDVPGYWSNNNKVFSFASAHNDIEVFDNWEKSLFSMNWSYSSWIHNDTKVSYFKYINEVTKIIDSEKPKNILVIWAAWFSLPQDIAKRDYVEIVDVCDIDNSLVNISEEYFLKEKLNEKIEFYPMPARYFLTKKIQEEKKYDFIFIDAYHWKISIPSQLLTKEFFTGIQALTDKTITMNLILDSAKISDFYNNLSNTLANSIDNPYIKAMGWWWIRDNFILVNTEIPWYSRLEKSGEYQVYVDNKNSLELDKYNLFYWNKK